MVIRNIQEEIRFYSSREIGFRKSFIEWSLDVNKSVLFRVKRKTFQGEKVSGKT